MPSAVIMPNPRRAPPVQTAPLPPAVLVALRSIKADLQNVPWDCFVDRAELLFWLRKMARRVGGIERLQVTISRPAVQQHRPTLPRPVSPIEAAEAVFGKSAAPATSKPTRRTITSRKGRVVTVETRQLALSL